MILPYVDYISGEIVQDVRTGQEKTTRSLTFLEQELFDPFFQTSYELYEVYADTVQARLSSNFYLPVFYTKKTYYELQRTSHIATADEIRAIAAKNLGKHLADLEEKGVQIIEKHVMIEKMDSDYIAQGSITVRGTIAIEANGETEGTDDILDDTQARGA
jgi:similar to stage IV sporulation protein